MYIVQVITKKGVQFIHELTQTTVSFTDNWANAQHFHLNDLLPTTDLEERIGCQVMGYEGV